MTFPGMGMKVNLKLASNYVLVLECTKWFKNETWISAICFQVYREDGWKQRKELFTLKNSDAHFNPYFQIHI